MTTREPQAPRAMLGYAFVDGFMRLRCRDAIEHIKAAIAIADGVIVDFAFFENKAVRVSVEIEAGAVQALAKALEAEGMQLFERCAAELMKASDVTNKHKPVTAMLHVALLKEEVGRLAGS